MKDDSFKSISEMSDAELTSLGVKLRMERVACVGHDSIRWHRLDAVLDLVEAECRRRGAGGAHDLMVSMNLKP